MVENSHAVTDESLEDPASVSAPDAASYIYEITREMSGLADFHGLNKLAAALELARGLAAEALAAHAIQSRSGKAAPEEAT